jgi:hypothetical protein
MRPAQPVIELFKVRLDSADATQSMVKYIEVRGFSSRIFFF